MKYAKFSIFEDQGPEDEKDLGPGPPLRTVWPVPVQDRDSPNEGQTDGLVVFDQRCPIIRGLQHQQAALRSSLISD